MDRVAAIPSSGAEPSVAAKIQKAATEFEAVLLNTVLGGVEKAFTQLPGKREQQTSEAYSGLAMQGLASGIAERGGIGLRKLIAAALSKREAESGQKNITEEVKGF
jgi:Rod binding domain-containing protein